MRVLVFERNLMWSSKLLQSLRALGHSATVATTVPDSAGEADLAIVNLGDNDVEALVQKLHRRDIKVIAHAGHKEKELLETGIASGADLVVTNSEMSFKLPDLIAQLEA